MSKRKEFELVAADVCPPGHVGAFWLYRSTTTGIYAMGDQVWGAASLMHPCPQEWARAVHMQTLIRTVSRAERGRPGPTDTRATRADVARALCVSLGTLQHWMQPYGSPDHCTPPAMAIKLLELIGGEIRRTPPAKKSEAA